MFCNDRSIGINESAYTNFGYGANRTYYAASTRLYGGSPGYTKIRPQFTCPQKNDAFTVNDTNKGNGALTYPVGLITADEMVAAGAGQGNNTNNKYYLYKSNYTYWSLSPSF